MQLRHLSTVIVSSRTPGILVVAKDTVLAGWRVTGCHIEAGRLRPWASAVITYAAVLIALVRRGPNSYKCFYVQQVPGEWPM